MFSDIENRIKLLAKIIIIAGVFLSICLLLVGIYLGVYCIFNSQLWLIDIFTITISVILGVGSWIFSYILYGFGELIESNQKIAILVEKCMTSSKNE